MFKKYPKKRPALPEEYREIYNAHYRDNREGKGTIGKMAKWMEEWMHRRVAEDMANAQGDPETLEIGAGNLNHLPYETVISNYDVVEPFKELLNSSPNIERVRTVYTDISDIGQNRKYDRIISIACFEHLEDLPGMVEQASRLLSPKGQLRVAIPNEGTIFWKLGTRLTGYKFKKKYGLDYRVLLKHEHLNNADEIEEVLRFYFSEVKCRVFGISRRLAFYRYYECKGLNDITSRRKEVTGIAEK